MCVRHDQLFAIYRRTVRSFVISLDGLQAAIAISPQDSQVVQVSVEQARAISEQARINLEKHIREHGCQDEDSTLPESSARERKFGASPRESPCT